MLFLGRQIAEAGANTADLEVTDREIRNADRRLAERVAAAAGRGIGRCRRRHQSETEDESGQSAQPEQSLSHEKAPELKKRGAEKVFHFRNRHADDPRITGESGACGKMAQPILRRFYWCFPHCNNAAYDTGDSAFSNAACICRKISRTISCCRSHDRPCASTLDPLAVSAKAPANIS